MPGGEEIQRNVFDDALIEPIVKRPDKSKSLPLISYLAFTAETLIDVPSRKDMVGTYPFDGTVVFVAKLYSVKTVSPLGEAATA